MTYSQAIAEAYATADMDEVILDTVELIHPGFVDDNGNPTAVRIVRAIEKSIQLRLEQNAPLNGGQIVSFVGVPFNFTMPAFKVGQVPSFQLAIDNVSREVTKYLEMAIAQITPITVIYRPYLASDPSGPQLDPPYQFTLTNAKADVFQITGTCTMNDVYNWPFPKRKYLPAEWKGLVR